jgi:hypothetical protein
MMDRKISIPELILIAGTRVALGVGIGFLIGGRLSDDSRRAAGIALAVVGGLSTIPLAMGLMSHGEVSEIRRTA